MFHQPPSYGTFLSFWRLYSNMKKVVGLAVFLAHTYSTTENGTSSTLLWQLWSHWFHKTHAAKGLHMNEYQINLIEAFEVKANQLNDFQQ